MHRVEKCGDMNVTVTGSRWWAPSWNGVTKGGSIRFVRCTQRLGECRLLRNVLSLCKMHPSLLTVFTRDASRGLVESQVPGTRQALRLGTVAQWKLRSLQGIRRVQS
jgi:hypothetical protein